MRVVVRLEGLPGGNPPWVAVHILRPEGGPVIPLPLRDNGAAQFGDDKAGDGLHSAYFRGCETAGRYKIVAIIVKHGGRSWRFPSSVSWEVTPADPVGIAVEPQPAPEPYQARALIKVTSRFSGAQRCEVSTASGLGKLGAADFTVGPGESAEIRLSYGRDAIDQLQRAGKFAIEGFWVRRGRLADEVVVLAYPRGEGNKPERVSQQIALPVELPLLAKWQGTIIVLGAGLLLMVAVVLIVDRARRPYLRWTVAVYDFGGAPPPSDQRSAREFIGESGPIAVWRPEYSVGCKRLRVGGSAVGECGLLVQGMDTGEAIDIRPLRGGGVVVTAIGKLRLQVVGDQQQLRSTMVFTEEMLVADGLLIHLQPPQDEEEEI